MNRILQVTAFALLVVGCAWLCVAHERSTQSAHDNSRMWAYRTLADLSFEAFQKGDRESAGKLARVLERTWDQGELRNSSDGSFCKSHRSICLTIDQALDAFIAPILGQTGNASDIAEVKAAYRDFQEKLKRAD